VNFRDLPSIDSLLQDPTVQDFITDFGRPLTVEALRAQLEWARSVIREGGEPPNPATLLERSRLELSAWIAPTLRPVINATGVIIHTNLGRAPLSSAARKAMLETAQGYSTLEYDLARGERGSRDHHSETLLVRLTGAEAALVVNNNAAAVLLALTAVAQGQDVLVSRSQLIEIGGGFRVPDVMKQSGANLVEVGTTNRTHLRDFEKSMNERTGMILHAHHSNFRIIGFTAEPGLKELVALGNQHAIPVLADLGSGALLDTHAYGLGHEPTVQETIQTGVTLTAFSGDKLLGGPQAGILLGESTVLDELRDHPLTRAMRPDKLCLAALSATLTHYLKDEAEEQIPIWQMIAASPEALGNRASAWAERFEGAQVSEGSSTVGGGSLPEETLPTSLLALSVPQPDAFCARLRALETPIIARIVQDRVVLDPRTVLPEQEQTLLAGLEQAMNEPRTPQRAP
jgi:L-seryl-tRNA(Ser) seleniumtransferase